MRAIWKGSNSFRIGFHKGGAGCAQAERLSQDLRFQRAASLCPPQPSRQHKKPPRYSRKRWRNGCTRNLLIWLWPCRRQQMVLLLLPAARHYVLLVSQPRQHPVVGVRGDEHRPPQAASPGHRGPGNRAASRQPAIARPGRFPGSRIPICSMTARCTEHAEQMAAFVRSRHIPRFILYPYSAAREFQRPGQLPVLEERGDGETAPINARDRAVERGHQIAIPGIGDAVRHCHLVRVHERPITKVRVILGAAREADARQVEYPGQHVIDIVGAGPGAPERVRVVLAGQVAAARGNLIELASVVICRRLGDQCRSLNSPIIASQAGSRSRSPVPRTADPAGPGSRRG